MKAVLAAVAMILVASCGRVESNSNLDSAVARLALGFQKDLRPVDGPLTQLTIAQNDNQHVTVTITTQSGRSNITKVNKLSDRFLCNVPTNVRFSIDCRHDMRPVDGALTQVTVVQTGDNSFDAKIIHSFFDQRTGKEVTTTNDIGTKMKQFYVAQQH